MPQTFPVGNLQELAYHSQVPIEILSAVVARQQDGYTEFHLPKRGSRGSRVISAPVGNLAKAQRWILDNLLTSPSAIKHYYAYSGGSSIKACASVHVNAKWLIKLDLKDFFTSISEERVFAIFETLGAKEAFSSDLSRICTREPLLRSVQGARAISRTAYLPQGAPSSGMLANMAASSLDRTLYKCANHFGLRFTRYSDDLTFSSTHRFSRDRAWKVVNQVRSKVAGHQFTLNEGKIRIRPPGSRLVVLGLLVDTNQPRLRTDVKKTLTWHLHGSERFGIDQYSASRGFSSIEGYLRHVDGLFAHALEIEPGWAGPLRHQWFSISDAPNGRLLNHVH